MARRGVACATCRRVRRRAGARKRALLSESSHQHPPSLIPLQPLASHLQPPPTPPNRRFNNSQPNRRPQIFSTPRRHHKSKPFFDHVISFTHADGRVWFRNYQVSVCVYVCTCVYVCMCMCVCVYVCMCV
jgi:hypothetical protein